MSAERGLIRWAPGEWTLRDRDGNVVRAWTVPVDELDDDWSDDDVIEEEPDSTD